MVGSHTVAEIAHKFEMVGFALTISPIGTDGRYVARAIEVSTGRGLVAVGYTPEVAAAGAWRRFDAHRPYYTRVIRDSGPLDGTSNKPRPPSPPAGSA